MARIYDWLNDQPRNEKIFGSRLNDEFDGLASDITDIEADILALQALPACFSVHKNGTNQTGLADGGFVLLTWSTELYDVGNHFASNAWVPPAGKVTLTATAYLSGTTPIQVFLAIYKNGGVFRRGATNASSIAGADITIEDIANGSDSYTVYAFLDVTSGTGTADGSALLTYFMGHWISA